MRTHDTARHDFNRWERELGAHPSRHRMAEAGHWLFWASGRAGAMYLPALMAETPDRPTETPGHGVGASGR